MNVNEVHPRTDRGRSGRQGGHRGRSGYGGGKRNQEDHPVATFLRRKFVKIAPKLKCFWPDLHGVSGGKKPVLEKFEKGEKVMKKWEMIVLIGCLFVVPSLAQAQADKLLERFFGREESTIRPEDLRVLQLEISPDPVRQGQRVVFRVTISNSSRHSGRVTIVIKDKDQIISEAGNVPLR